MSGPPIIDLGDEALLEVAAADLTEALLLYAFTGNHTARGAIRWLDTLRRSLDETRQQIGRYNVDAEA